MRVSSSKTQTQLGLPRSPTSSLACAVSRTSRTFGPGLNSVTQLVAAIDTTRRAIRPRHVSLRGKLQRRAEQHVVLDEADRQRRRLGARFLLNVLIAHAECEQLRGLPAERYVCEEHAHTRGKLGIFIE